MLRPVATTAGPNRRLERLEGESPWWLPSGLGGVPGNSSKEVNRGEDGMETVVERVCADAPARVWIGGVRFGRDLTCRGWELGPGPEGEFATVGAVCEAGIGLNPEAVVCCTEGEYVSTPVSPSSSAWSGLCFGAGPIVGGPDTGRQRQSYTGPTAGRSTAVSARTRRRIGGEIERRVVEEPGGSCSIAGGRGSGLRSGLARTDSSGM